MKGLRAEISLGWDPEGRPAVIAGQFNDFWITLLPDDARDVAVRLIAAAEAVAE